MSSFDVIGKSFNKSDAYSKAAGKAVYVADRSFQNMLYGAVLHSPVAHAIITSIDISKAVNMDGVVYVATYEDVPDTPFTTCGHPFPYDTPLDNYILHKHVRYVGDCIAAVAAETPEVARQAIQAIKIEYDELPAYFTCEEALDDNAVEIHEGLKNISGETSFEIGEVDRAMAEAAYVFEDTIELPIVAHCQIENHVSIVEEEIGTGRLIIYASTQTPNIMRERTAYALGLPLSKIRVIKGHVGGGFGGKQEPVYEIINAFLTLKCHRPVMLELTREENLTATRTRHSQKIILRSALDKDYKFIAREARIYSNTGAYSSHGNNVVAAQSSHFQMLYPTPNIRFYGVSVYTNILVAGAMRGYGAPQWHAAMEAHVDNIARQLGMDPITFHEINVIKKNQEVSMYAMHNSSCALEEIIARGRAEIGWDSFLPSAPDSKIKKGIGMALATYVQCCYPWGVELSGARVTVHEDGFTTIMTGAGDVGQGTETGFKQIAAEILGFPYEWMHYPELVDTDVNPFDPGAFASRETYVVGKAVRAAAEKCKKQILEFASQDKNIEIDRLDIRKGNLIYKDSEEVICPIKDVTWKIYYRFPEAATIDHTAYNCADDDCYTYCGAFALVTVDTATGKVQVDKLRTYVDCGQVINPVVAKGQLIGGAIMSMGYALSEQLLIDPDTGRVLNGNLLDYKLLTMADIPDLEGGFEESFEPSSAVGNKSLGEPPNLAPAAAIRNAIVNATGVTMNKLPLTPERVWNYLNPVEDEKEAENV